MSNTPDVHNIVSGHVTNRRDHVPFRVTARKISKRVLITVGVIFVLMLALGLTLNAMNGDVTGEGHKSLPACQFEDSPHCYWDADTMGNGVGHDVVNK
jgi:hypothetical protein